MTTRTIYKVGDLCDQIRGVTYSKSDATLAPTEGFKPVLRANNITEIGLTFDDLVYVPANNVANKQKLKANDVLIAASSGSIEVVGKAARVLSDFDGGFGAFCKVLRPNTKVDPSYFSHYFKTKDYRRRISSLAAGANINNLRNEHLDDLEIALPPLPEQRRIAAILDKADALRAKRREAIAKLDQLLQSVFLEMFGDPVTNPKGWPTVSIQEACESIVDCVNRTAPTVDYPTEYKMIRTTNVRNHQVKLDNVKCVEKEVFDQWNRRLKPRRGDVILTREAPAGEAGILESDDQVFLGQRLMLYRANSRRATSEYLLYSFMGEGLQQQFMKQSSGSTVKHLSVPDCRSWQLLLPPLEQQEKFSEMVRKSCAIRQQALDSLGKLDNLFSSLQKHSFSMAD